MKKFTYDQCDRLHKKMNNLQDFVNQHYQSAQQKYQQANLIHQCLQRENVQYQTLKNRSNKKRLNQVNKENNGYMYETQNYYKQQKAPRPNIEFQTIDNRSEKGYQENKPLREKCINQNQKISTQIQKPYLKKQNKQSQKSKISFLKPDNNHFFFQSSVSNQSYVSQKPTNMYQYQNYPSENQTHTNNNLKTKQNNFSKTKNAQKKYLNEINSRMQAQYKFEIDKNKQINYEEKFSSINSLNDQIKSIMVKYDYNFTSQETGNFVSKKRITLPSYRKINTSKDQAEQYKNCEIPLQIQKQLQKCFNKKININQDQFSPYSQSQKSNTALKIKKQQIKKANKFIDEQLIENKETQSFVKQKIKVQNQFHQLNIFDRIQIKNNERKQHKMKQKQHSFTQKMNSPYFIDQRKWRVNLKNDRIHKGRSLSCLQNIKRSTLYKQNIDKSIEQLNEKIKVVQEKKKQLNINFKPFSLQNFKSHLTKINSNSHVSQETQIQKNWQQNQPNHIKFYPESNLKISINKENLNQKSISSRLVEEQQSKFIFNQYQSTISYLNSQLNSNLTPSNISQVQVKRIRKQLISKPSLISKTIQNQSFAQSCQTFQTQQKIESQQIIENIKYNKNDHIPNTTTFLINQNIENQNQTSILSCQKKLNKSVISLKKVKNSKNQTQKLILSLIKQIQLDQTFRNLKIWFQFYNSDKNKWENLKNKINQIIYQRKLLNQSSNAYQNKQNTLQKLQQSSITILQMTDKQLKQHFSASLNQHDPFFIMEFQNKSVQNKSQNPLNSAYSSFNLLNLIESFQNSQNFWNQEIKNKFRSHQLIKSGFSANNIDFQRKGFVSIEDLIRFLNMSVNSSYRNRDLMLIYKRIKNSKHEESKHSKLIEKSSVLNKDNHNIQQKTPEESQKDKKNTILFRDLLNYLCMKQRI